MKRFMALLGVVLWIGMWLGRSSGRTGSKHLVVPSPSSLRGSTTHHADIPLEGRLQPFRRWVVRYRDILDPVFVLAVALGAAVATGYFALQTNAINSDQRELLERQIDIQESQALPVFHITATLVRDENGMIVTEQIILSNHGGLARNAYMDIYTWVRFAWIIDITSYSTTSTSSSWGVPVSGYYGQLTDPDVAQGEWVFGTGNNELYFRAYVDQIEQKLEQQYGTGEVSYHRGALLRVRYTDYLGNERTEYYDLFLPRDEEGVINDPRLFSRDHDVAESELQQYNQARDEGVIMFLGSEGVDNNRVDLIVSRLYEEFRGDGPVATPPSSGND